MSAVNATIQALLAAPGIAALSGTRIAPTIAAETVTDPNIVVNLVFEAEVPDLADRSRFAEARVSIECRATTATAAANLAEAVKDALMKRHTALYAGCRVRFVKEGSDFTDYEPNASIKRRVLDFHVWWRKAA